MRILIAGNGGLLARAQQDELRETLQQAYRDHGLVFAASTGAPWRAPHVSSRADAGDAPDAPDAGSGRRDWSLDWSPTGRAAGELKDADQLSTNEAHPRPLPNGRPTGLPRSPPS
jgi:hypothetical protein